ncbi:MAG: hypothetical protein FWG77_03950 [Treponema sp.]|nr:hypothetical protein [Treponema sp.]
MKDFLISKRGNNILGIVLTIIFFLIVNTLFGLGGAIGGAIAGALGFGGAAVLKLVLKPKEENTDKTDS